MRDLLKLILINFFVGQCFSEAAFSAQDVVNLEPANPEGGALAFYVENDSQYIGGPGTDRGYSNGLKASYIYAQGEIPYWSRKIVNRAGYVGRTIKESEVNFGLSLGHQIFTPEDTSSTELILDDRPYAGYLSLGFGVSLKRAFTEQFFVFEVGTVGPSARGEFVQNNFHKNMDMPIVRGWRNGLNDELILQAHFQQRVKYLEMRFLDLIPYYGLSLGNLLIGGHVGSLLRIGYNLPKTYGANRPSASNGSNFISPSQIDKNLKTSVFLYGGVRSNLVGRNLFLDGNSFRPSHRVSKHPVNFETEVGLGLQFDRFGLSWSLVTQSPEFRGRDRYNNFASLNLVYLH